MNLPINNLHTRQQPVELPARMKAISIRRYGSPDHLQLQSIPLPRPGRGEVLIKVAASAVTAADSMMRRAQPWISRLFLGLLKPRNHISGTGFAGDVIAVGQGVQQFRPGQRVFGETGLQFGANAEYLCVSETGVLAPIPAGMSYEEAAPLCDGALTALNFLKELGNIQAGQQLLIIGASGSLGTAAIQLAKYYGATVAAVCGPANLGLVQRLGADAVLDYTRTHFTQHEQQYDLIFDTVAKSSFSQAKAALKAGGRYLCPVLGAGLLLNMLTSSLRGSKKALFSATGMLPPQKLRGMLATLTHLIDVGKLKTVIGRRYPLEQAAAAHRYVDTGHKRGNVVLIP